MTTAPTPDIDVDPRPGLRGAAARHPVGVVWFGVTLFSTGPVIVAGAGISGQAFSFWRLWMGVAILGLATAVQARRSHLHITARGLRWAVGSGVAFAAHQLAFMTALQATSVVDVTLMNTVAPVVVGALAVPMFGERPGARFRAWSVVAMAGAAAVVVAGSSGPEGDPWGMALAAANVAFYALYFVGSKAARDEIDTVPFLWAVIVVAAVSASTFALATDLAVTPISADDLLRCLAVAVLPGTIGHFSVTWALRWVPANIPPVIMLSIPVVSGALAWITLGQSVRGGQVLAGVATLIGVLGAVRSPSAPRLGADDALAYSEET